MAEIDRWNFDGGVLPRPDCIALDGESTTIHKASFTAAALRALIEELSAGCPCYPDPHDHEPPCPQAEA